MSKEDYDDYKSEFKRSLDSDDDLGSTKATNDRDEPVFDVNVTRIDFDTPEEDEITAPLRFTITFDILPEAVAASWSLKV